MGKNHGVKRFFVLLLSTIFTITQLITVPIFAAEHDKNEDQLLVVTPSLTPNRQNNTYEVGESFDIDYEIKPKDIDKEKYDEWYKSKGKKKEIVLVIDTSGSMDCPQKTDDKDNKSNKDYYYNIENWALISNKLKIKLSGCSDFYEVKMGAQFYIEINKEEYYIEGNRCYKNFKEETRLNIAKNKAKEFIDQFEDEKNVSIGLVSFASKIKSINPLTDDFSSVKKEIKQLEAGGGTNIGEALRRAHDMLNKSKNKEADKYIVLMTDGFPTAFSLMDYEKSIQKETQDNYWFNNYLGYVENDSKEICKFVNINNPKFKEGFDFKNQEYAVNYGDNDLNNYALNYSKKIAQNVKNDNINSFIIGFSDGANSEKLNDIAKAAGGEYREANNEEALKEAYDKIGNKVKAPLIKNLEFEFSIPEGLEIEEIKNSITNEAIKPIKRDDTTYYINLQNIIYDCNKDSNSYFSKNKNVKLKLKCLQKGEHEVISSVNKKEDGSKKSICNKSIKVNVVENSIVELKQKICDEKDNGYHVGDEIKINYNIKLKPVSNYSSEPEDKKEQITNKSKKKIVLVVDTSGSMEVNESNKKDKYIGTIIKEFNIRKFRYRYFICKNNNIFREYIEISSDEVVNGSFEIDGKKVYVKGNEVYEYDENNHSRLECVKKVANNFVDKFKDDNNTEIALVSYSNKGNIVDGNSNAFVSGKDHEIMKKRINNLEADGGTNIGDGIRRAYSILDKCDKDTEKYMILMTDGVPTAYTCYSDSIKIYNDYTSGNEWNIQYYPNGEVIENNRKYYYNKIDKFNFKLENDNKNESYIVKFGDEYDENALEYAKQAMEKSKSKNINNIIVGFSDGIDTAKLKEIAGNNAQYKEAKDLNELTKKYDEIEKDINTIKAPSVSNLEFNLKLPKGLEVVDDFGKNTNLKLQKTDNNSSNIIGNINDIKYSKSEDGKTYTPERDNINFDIKVKIKENKDYVLGENEDKATLSYKDIYGLKYVEEFTPQIKITMNKLDIKVDKFGILKSNSGSTIEECIQNNKDNNILVMNNFMYQVGMVIEVNSDIDEDVSIKNDFSIDNKNETSKLDNELVKGAFLYELNGKVLKNISDDKIYISDGKITIKGGNLKKGQKYIVTQGVLFKGIENNTALKDDIEINDNKTSKQITINKSDSLPDLD